MKRNSKIDFHKIVHACKQMMRQSLLFQAMRISTVIFLLIGGIFAIAPHETYMASQQSCKDISITDSRLDTLSFVSSEIDFMDFSELRIRLGYGKTFSVDGVEYDDSYCIAICADSEENKCIISSELLSPPIACSAMNVGILDTRQSFTFDNGLTTLAGMDNYYFLGTSEGAPSVTIAPYAGVKIYQGDQLIASFSEEKSDLITIDDCFGTVIESNGNKIKMFGCEELEAQFSEINQFRSVGEGTLQFDYSQGTKSMNVANQEITGEGNLSAKISFKEEKCVIDLFGVVEEATFSGLDLFPSFFSWYRNSVYLIPTTIVTVVIGAISLISKKDK